MPAAEETIVIDAAPERVLEVLSDPEAATDWFPLPVDLVDAPSGPIETGDEVTSRGELAGRSVEFDIKIDEVRDDGVSVSATGPLTCEVNSHIRPHEGGTELTVALTVESGGGVAGGVMAAAAKPVTGAWLRQALDAIRARAEG